MKMISMYLFCDTILFLDIFHNPFYILQISLHKKSSAAGIRHRIMPNLLLIEGFKALVLLA